MCLILVVTGGQHIKYGRRSSVLQTFDEFSCSDWGRGQTGDEIAYAYPNKETALIDQFEDGQLIKKSLKRTQQ